MKPMSDIPYDVIFSNALVFDGSEADPKIQDLAIVDNKIFAIGNFNPGQAKSYIDCSGLALAPGFIDVHTHDDFEVIRNPQLPAKLSQGVTTVIAGNCGISGALLSLAKPPPDPLNLLGEQQEFQYDSFAQYEAAVNKACPGVNVAALIGHTTLRCLAMEDLSKAATEAELEVMRKALVCALEQGALGLSSGLAYHNAKAAPASEVQVLANELAKYQGIYTTHLRTEFDAIVDAMDEAFELAKEAQVPLVISHLKCAGKNNWGRAPEVVKHMQHANQTQHVGCDCYPYSASSSTLDLDQVTDDFEISITWSEPHPDQAGKSLQQIATDWDCSLIDAAKRLQPAGAVYHCMSPDDVETVLESSLTAVGSDGLPCDPNPHPRLWGSFPRVLGYYSRERELFSLSTAIYKMTGLSASRYKLAKRGFIRAGYFADLVLFDPDKIKDKANFVNPTQPAEGVLQVWVNGTLSYSQLGQSSRQLGDFSVQPRAGKFLKHLSNDNGKQND